MATENPQNSFEVKGNFKELEMSPSVVKNEFENAHVQEITTKEEKNAILDKAQILGEDFYGDRLQIRQLRQNGLHPKYKIKVEDVTYYFSVPYYIGELRTAVVGYIEKAGVTTVCSFYQSNSSIMWRYLPAYRVNKDGKVNNFDKGYEEESCSLPFLVQKGFSEISKLETKPLTLEKAKFIFIATTTKRSSQKESKYFDEVKSAPNQLQGDFYPPIDGEPGYKTPPEQMLLNKEQSPDFKNLISTYQTRNAFYGPCTVDIFLSKDGKYKFMFCHDKEDRAWIAGVELVSSSISSVGVNTDWVSGGDLTTPAWEDAEQCGDYANRFMKKGAYFDMSDKYLRDIDVIQDYELWFLDKDIQELKRKNLTK